MSMLRVERVGKRYGARTVLENISFTAGQGEVIALLGRNGAGKSTLMNILTGYIAMTEGAVSVDGCDVQRSPMQARKRVGYLPEQPPLYAELTVREYLHYCARLKGLPRETIRAELERVIECASLREYEHRLTGRLSKGYRQRLGVAQALLGNPPLLILDEPGSGLDPVQMRQMRDVIRTASACSTVLLSSHMLSEVTNVCSRALVIADGRLRYDGSMDALLAPEGFTEVRYRGGKGVCAALSRLDGVLEATAFPTADEAYIARVRHAPNEHMGGELAQCVLRQGGELEAIQPARIGLEEAFLRLVEGDGRG